MNDIKLHKAPHRWPLVLIALDKLVKATGLTIISFVLSPKYREPIAHWVDNAQLGPHNWFVRHLLTLIDEGLDNTPSKARLIQICIIIYAGLYLIEGAGLLFEQKWAEWMVVIGTAAFLPVEIVDFIRRPSWAMVILFVLNLVMAMYLAWRLHRQAVIERERAEHPELVGKR